MPKSYFSNKKNKHKKNSGCYWVLTTGICRNYSRKEKKLLEDGRTLRDRDIVA